MRTGGFWIRVTPGIARFMPWEPPSWSEYRDRSTPESAGIQTPNKFVGLRHPAARSIRECLGMASLEDADSVSPELGLWLKESAHGQGFGREVVAALVEWGHATLGKGSFIYPVAVQNTASRQIAESLHGEIIGNRTNPKYDSVVYTIPFYESPYSS